MTQPENPRPGDTQSRAGYTKPDGQPLTRPAIGVLVDPERMAAARKSAMLERVELSDLSKVLELGHIAQAASIDLGGEQDIPTIKTILTAAGINLAGKRIGISRDEIAKLETGGRKRPKITTLRKFLATINHARAQLGEPPIGVKDIQVPGEVLIPEPPTPTAADRLAVDPSDRHPEGGFEPGSQAAIDAYQEASNEIYYATEAKRREIENDMTRRAQDKYGEALGALTDM